ncbi:MAG TPA: CHAD domain-containing protein [Rhodocyclaceae bacterium]
MPREIELKLRLDPAAVEIMARHPALSGVRPVAKRLCNTYYDTADLSLRRSGIALRFRRSGRQWMLTVKGGNPGAGGLAARDEWEVPRRPGDFDFGHVDDEAIRQTLEAARSTLAPLFTTDFRRVIWRIPSPAGGGIEIALDVGTITAGRRSEALCEVELERHEAEDSAPLFALAGELAETLPLHPEARSKAERGYALFGKLAEKPRKTAPTPVNVRMSPIEAFQAIAFDCLDQLLRNETGAIAGDDPEFVHQARIGIRRLRSALGLFAPILPASLVQDYAGPWREVANALGGGRDWDVLMHETLPRVARFNARHGSDYSPPKALTRAAARAHEKALATTRVALLHPGYSRFLLQFSAAAHGLGDADAPIVPGALAPFARARMDRQLRRVWRIVATTHLKTHLHRHELRIELKKLRYATDFFAPLIPAKPLARYRKRVAALQDILGLLNDITVGRELISSLKHRKGPDPLDNWLATDHARVIKGLAGALKRLRRANPPWQ